MQKVLIIDDDPTAAHLIQEYLQLPDCKIEVADGNASALHQLRSSAFEIVLTSPTSTIKEDLSLVSEIEGIRPGVRMIVLAPEGNSRRCYRCTACPRVRVLQ